MDIELRKNILFLALLSHCRFTTLLFDVLTIPEFVVFLTLHKTRGEKKYSNCIIVPVLIWFAE